MIGIIDEDSLTTTIEERLGVEELATGIMNLDNNSIDEYDDMMSSLVGRNLYTYEPKKLDINLKNRTTPLARPSIEEPLVLELKALPSYLRYAFLRSNNTLFVIIVVDLLDTD